MVGAAQLHLMQSSPVGPGEHCQGLQDHFTAEQHATDGALTGRASRTAKAPQPPSDSDRSMAATGRQHTSHSKQIESKAGKYPRIQCQRHGKKAVTRCKSVEGVVKLTGSSRSVVYKKFKKGRVFVLQDWTVSWVGAKPLLPARPRSKSASTTGSCSKANTIAGARRVGNTRPPPSSSSPPAEKDASGAAAYSRFGPEGVTRYRSIRLTRKRSVKHFQTTSDAVQFLGCVRSMLYKYLRRSQEPFVINGWTVEAVDQIFDPAPTSVHLPNRENFLSPV